MKKALLIICAIFLSIITESKAAEQTYNKMSSNSKVETALNLLNEFNSQLPSQILENLYIISTKGDRNGAEIIMKLAQGDTFIKTSIDFGVYNMIGYLCYAAGLSESEAKRNGFNVKAVLYDSKNKVIYTNKTTAYDCLAYYNRQKSTPSLAPSLDSFRDYADGLNKEAPRKVGEGITVTSVKMYGKQMIFNHSVSSFYAQLFKQRGNDMKVEMERWKMEIAQGFYEFLKDVLDFMEKEKIDFRYRLFEEGTNNMLYELIITPQDIKRSYQMH